MTTATTSIVSIGYLCQQLQKPFMRVRKAIERLGIKPALVVNGVEHFDDESIEKLARHFADASKATPPIRSN